MRRLAWKLLGIPSVVLVDFDGEETVAYVNRDHVGPWCNRLDYSQHEVRLLSGGAIDPVRRDDKRLGTVVDSWRPLVGEVRP